MANIAGVLKEEITRVARKELRTEIDKLRKSSSRYRSDIAALKRQAAELEKRIAFLEKAAPAKQVPKTEEQEGTSIRFSARSLRAQRRRLGLSAREMALILGVSEQTIYNWEAQKARPRSTQLVLFAATRTMGKEDARARLEELAG